MKKCLSLCGVSVILFAGCVTHYHVATVNRSRVLIDSRYDNAVAADNALNAYMAPFKQRVDSLMSPVVGTTDKYMAAYRPESDLSNLMADILVWGARQWGDQPDFAVYNMGGIRAALPKGDITVGDVLDVAPFENFLCTLTLSGEAVKELFEQIAARHGEAVSHGVALIITPKGRLLSARINGLPLDTTRSYRVATIDYVSKGNDHMTAFLKKTDVRCPKTDATSARNVITNYFVDHKAKGEAVTSRVEGRIKVEED